MSRKPQKKKKDIRSSMRIREERKNILTNKSDFFIREAYKTLRTNVSFSLTGFEDCKVILVTSSLQSEGKSITAVNLAISYAQTGRKVLVIDCDLRRPKIQRYLRIKASSQSGVSTVLNGSCSIDNAIGYVEELGIYVMLSGPIPPNPSELLSSERTKAILEELKTKFDFVICDTPPVGIVSDAVAFSQYMDGAVMVVRQNYASNNEIADAVSKLRAVETNLLGVVLNDYDSKYDTNYKYDKYYSYKYYYADEK